MPDNSAALRRASESSTPPASNRAVTLRSCLLALLLLPLNAYWVIQMESVRYSAHPTTISLFFNLIFILLVLTGLNRLAARASPRLALSRGEILFVYAVLAIGSCLCGHDLLQVLIPMLTWPYRFADGANQWETLIHPHLPKTLTISERAIYHGYYNGSDTLYRAAYLRAWMPVALQWSAFVAVLLFVMLCINSILRKQWTENERLSYPIVQLPLQMTSEGSKTPLLRGKLFWIGFGAAGLIDTINTLNVFYPWIPTILAPGRGLSYFNLLDWVTEKPWNAIGWTPISFYPFLVALGMFMPMDFLFSSWFFYLFWKGQAVLAVAMAWDQDPRFPYTNNQAFGAYMVFCLVSLWLSRRYLGQVLRKALGRRSELDDSAEPLSYRCALLGIVAGLAFLVWFSAQIGMGPWLPIVFFLIYFALCVAITRMRAEMGTPVHDLHWTGPDWILAETLGQKAFTPSQLAAFSVFYWFNRAYRSHPMPHQLEAFKMAEQTRTSYRAWFWGMAAFGFVAAMVGFWAMLHLQYDYGAVAKSQHRFGPEAYTRLEGWLKTPRFGNFAASMAIWAGAASALFLQAMRMRFSWWPFHPLGYAVTASWEINLVWMPLFVAWVLKSAILRYSGRSGLHRSLPFFVGTIFGQFVTGSFWNIYGIVMGVPTYQFWQ